MQYGEAHHNIFEEDREEVHWLLQLLTGQMQILGTSATAPICVEANEGELQNMRLASCDCFQEGQQALEALHQYLLSDKGSRPSRRGKP